MQEEVFHTMIRTFEDYLARDSRKLSPEQLAVVYSDIATIVSAGAGSGKTTVLSYRFLRLLMQGKAKVDEILTLTFTKKAASEMYERIFRIVEKEASSGNELLASQMKDFASAYISTLDSFASEIARTDSVRYGVSRDFEILDDDENTRLIDRICNGIFNDCNADVLKLAERLSPQEIGALFSEISYKAGILVRGDEAVFYSCFDEFLSSLMAFARQNVKQSIGRIGEFDIPPLSSKEIFNPSSGGYYRTVEKLLEKGMYEDMPRKYNKRGYTGKALDKSSWDALKAAMDDYAHYFSLLYSAWTISSDEGIRRAVASVFSRFISRINSEKRRLGLLSFSDVEALAIEILKNNRDVRRFYKNKFRYIMIDEFQDNSSRQRDLLFILSEKEDVDGLGVPEKEDLDNTKLFFVGDDKQSIYAFRGADVAVFNALKQDIVAIGGRHLTMETNYRSNPGLLEHFNSIFNGILSPEAKDDVAMQEEAFLGKVMDRNDLSGYEAGFERIGIPERKDTSRSMVVFAHTEKHGDEAEETERPVDDEELSAAENEAEFIARYIEEDVLGGEAFLVRDKTTGTLRRPTYSDIAILYQKTSAQMPLEKTFRKKGIPYTVVVSTSITLEAISSDFVAFLSLLLYPNDKVSYFHVLRSPFVRLSDEGLSFFEEFRKDSLLPEDKEAFSYIPESLGDEDVLRLKEAGRLYYKLRNMLGRSSLTMLLDVLYQESGYASFMKSSPTLSSYEEHFSYLWETAKGMESLEEFISYISLRLDESSKFDINLLRLENDGVQMMTIHKSKGLEFPIVILANAASYRSSPDTSRLVYYEGSSFLALDTSADRAVNGLFRDFRNRRIEAEKKRLLYVALTRAEEHLIIVATGKESSSKGYYYPESSMASMYLQAASENTYHDLEFPHLYESDIQRQKEQISISSPFYDRDCVPEGSFTRRKIGAKELGHVKNEEKESYNGIELKGIDDKTDNILRTFSLSVEFGTFVHAVFESFFKNLEAPVFYSEKLSEKENGWVTKEGERILSAFKSSCLYLSHIKAHECFSEEGFFTLEDGLVVEGSIDLLVLGEEYNLVVDYKTDRFYNPKDHEAQLRSYIRAAEALYPGKPCYAVLYYVRKPGQENFIDREGHPVRI